MRVFVAGLCHETSAFSPIPTTRASYESFEYYRPINGVPDNDAQTANGYGAFIREAARGGHDVFASTYTFAQPSARTVRSDYESLRDEILSDLRAAGDVDMALFFLHGAQMAEGYDDCEGDILARAREIVGDRAFVGALLDLHANVSPRMLESAVLVACRFYPHTDFDERAAHLFNIGVRAVSGEIEPVSHFRRLPMTGMFYTTEPLMVTANDAALALQEQPHMLSVSLIHGFLWGNTSDVSAGVLAISDGPRASTDADVGAVARLFFAAREETRSLRKTSAEILDYVEAQDDDAGGKPFVIADACDNAGGGAGSDSTFILEEVLARKLDGFAIGLLWDPMAVEFAEASGVGSTLNLRLGGKTGPQAGKPLDVEARVVGVYEELFQSGIGYTAPMGRCATLEIDGNVVVVNTVRGQVFSPTCFTDCGVRIESQKALVVKSSQHFYEQFAPIAREVLYCETPGSLSLNPDPEIFFGLDRPIWPIDDAALEEHEV